MKIKLVIADDAAFIREVIREALESTEIDIVGEATNGKEAVKLTLETKPDVVLMDIVMPEQSGIEATHEIKEALPSVRVIACSTVSQSSMIVKALEAGCSSYIVKPFKAEDLINAISSSVSEEPAKKVSQI